MGIGRTILLLLSALVLPCCKLEISVPPDGHVESGSGAYDCAVGDTCTISVEDAFFDETFSALPKQGYTFTSWRTRDRSFCGGSSKPCKLSTVGFQGTQLMDFLKSDDVFYLEPVFGRSNSWSPKADLPVPSGAISTCLVRGKLYVFGLGYEITSSAGNGDRVEEYDPSTDTWSRKADMPYTNVYASATAARGKCYLIGGFPRFDRVMEYDPQADRWRERAPLPEQRILTASVSVGGKIYVLGGGGGGYFFHPPPVAAVAIYDPVADQWSKGADMPEPRVSPAAGVIDGFIYTVGGSNTLSAPATNTVLRYDPQKDTWIRRAGAPVDVANASASVLSGNLYLLGGLGVEGINEPTARVYRYDPDQNQWSRRADMAQLRALAGSESIDGQIYVVGGRAYREGAPLASVEVYTP